MFSRFAVILVLSASSVLGNVFVTAPVASTSWAAGGPQTVQWEASNDTTDPITLAQFGQAMIGLYAGNADEQTLLQQISPNTDVSTTASIQWTPQANVGPTGDNYFIRFTSINFKDPANPQYPAEAFSAKFTLTGMSGTFNSTVQSEVDGQSTAPIGGTAAANPSAPKVAPTQAPATTTPSATKSASGAKSSGSSAAIPVSPNGFVAAAAGAAAAVLAVTLWWDSFFGFFFPFPFHFISFSSVSFLSVSFKGGLILWPT
jgi:hypothetical protein